MSLREVQIYALGILEDVHEFCIKNNIRYSLAYGTLLGAVRHQGFIPWDDDIDIVMPRPDYERFCKSFKSANNYEIFSSVNRNAYFNYARVCDLNETYVHSLPWCKKSPTGIWIDIFPLDGINKSDNRENEIKELNELNKKKMFYRVPKDNLHRPMSFKLTIKTIIKKTLLCWTKIESVVDQYDTLIKHTNIENSELCGVKAITTYWERDIYPKFYFEDFVELYFEGYKFCAIKEFDKYLSQIYGDYMQLPPVEKRVRHPQEMFWI